MNSFFQIVQAILAILQPQPQPEPELCMCPEPEPKPAAVFEIPWQYDIICCVVWAVMFYCIISFVRVLREGVKAYVDTRVVNADALIAAQREHIFRLERMCSQLDSFWAAHIASLNVKSPAMSTSSYEDTVAGVEQERQAFKAA
jgi:hypothetical protein